MVMALSKKCYPSVAKVCVIVLVIAMAMIGAGCEKLFPPKPASQTKTRTAYTAETLGALAVANEFCQAWRLGQVAQARKLLSRQLVMSYPDERINASLMTTSNPRHIAFEIFGGEVLSDGRVAFSIKLFHSYAGQVADRIEGPRERIVLGRLPEGGWCVDEFPIH